MRGIIVPPAGRRGHDGSGWLVGDSETIPSDVGGHFARKSASRAEITPLPNLLSPTPPIYIEKGFTQFSLRASSTLL